MSQPDGPARWSSSSSRARWVLPLLTSLVAGDVFAVEDRLGTWRHLLVAVRSPRRIFLAKALASLTVILLAGRRPVASSTRRRPRSRSAATRCVGLDGHLIAPGERGPDGPARLAERRSPPTLAFSAVGLLGSVALGRSPLGLLMPACSRSCSMGLCQLLPVPVAVRRRAAEQRLPRLARPVHRARPDSGRCWIGIAVSLAWAVLATFLAYRCSCAATSPTWPTTAPAAAFVVAAAGSRWSAWSRSTTVVVAATTGATGSGIDRPKLEAALATSFAHLYGCRPSSSTARRSPRPQLHATRRVRQGRRPGRGRRARATTGAASSPGACPASTADRHRDLPARRDRRTGGTSPTATDPRRSTASSRCAPRPATHPTRCGSSTASSTCSITTVIEKGPPP